jgi:putative endonuclease
MNWLSLRGSDAPLKAISEIRWLRPDGPAMTKIEKNMKRELHPCIYIMTNKNNGVLYTGVTSNLFKRVAEYKDKVIPGFTNSYNVTKLVDYEEYGTMEEAIAREKQIKGGSSQKKIDLIKSKNPEWKDLYEEFFA